MFQGTGAAASKPAASSKAEHQVEILHRLAGCAFA